jgi:hypothetical protein
VRDLQRIVIPPSELVAMKYEELERRTHPDDRARFEEMKEFVAQELGRVGQRMPQPWFDDLVDSVTRLRIRYQHPT